MAIKVLALASGVTGLADHRVLNGAMMQPAGQISVRSGVLPGATSGNLSTVSAMVARVAPVKVLINNSISSALGPYLLVSDANVDITFDAGEAAVPRVDRIIARAYDNTNDASGSTLGNIYYLKGTSGGSATALPNNSVLLYEMTIPAGASAGGGGVNFANAVDQRAYTVAQGGIIPIKSNTEMSAISSPHEGMTIYRTDLDVLYVYDGSAWRAKGTPNVASSANLGDINGPYDGLMAVTRDTDNIYVYSGSTWKLTAIADPGWTAITLSAGYQSFSTGYVPGYKVIGNRVYLRGVVQRTAGGLWTYGSNFNIATLPVAIRPPSRMATWLATAQWSSTNPMVARLEIQTSGVLGIAAVGPAGGTAPTWIDINGSYDLES